MRAEFRLFVLSCDCRGLPSQGQNGGKPSRQTDPKRKFALHAVNMQCESALVQIDFRFSSATAGIYRLAIKMGQFRGLSLRRQSDFTSGQEIAASNGFVL